ncbi:pilus assembly protein FimV [Duganella sp. CF517]|uniref:FimV/HubP family polar landmark protein n=1 Tax=Duganella sp. CF517 TaxID=1881038 RepID=UPI0008CFFC00|nr:FimV/HubP family polar landmark protein [Duganella sp. CF517]SEN34227.1 pilus assembly protein FimV [Duganella sp. CF517]
MPFTNRTSIVSFALKTLTSAVAGAVLLSAAANAAGLGKLTVLSSLGQPLRAEIELTAVTAEEASGLVAQLASADAFRTANIDFNPALTSLRFEVEQRGGRQLIRVSSTQPVNEPFVDMLLELKWNGGRMVREYTFLLDPPDMRSANSPQVAAPVDLSRQATAPAAGAPNAPLASAPAVPAASAAGAGANPAPAAPRPQPAKSSTEQYTVKKGDNLSRIASQVKPGDISLDMMLVALYRANPEAFSGNNMNRLKSGQILKVPDAGAVRSIVPEGEARGVVVAHAVDFNAYRAKLAGQVASSTPAKEAETTQNVKGKITAKVEEKPNAVNEAKDKLTLSKSTASAPVAGKTGVAAEDNIAKQKQVDEAAARVKELEKNVNDLEKLMAVKNKTIAEKPPVAAAPAAPVAPPAAAPAATPAEAPKPKRTLAVPPRKPVEPSWYEVMMDNIQLVGLAVAALLALVYGIILARRRKGKKFVVVPGEIVMPPDPTTPIQPFITEAGAQNVDTSNSVFNSNFAPSASQLDTNEVDPVAEADVYIAYGRDAQAEDILKEALRTHPERHPVRLKLLEIYATRKDARAFESQASELYSLTRGQGDEWAQASALGQSIDPTNPLYSAAPDGVGGAAMSAAAVPVAAGAAAAAAAASAYSANDFGTGDDFGAEPPAAAPSGLDLDLGLDAASAKADNAMDFGRDLDDMETALPQPADASVSPASVAAQSDNLMDFDLGDMSFEPVASAKSPIEMPSPVRDEAVDDPFDLAFDAPAAPAAAPVAADDPSMDFSLDLPEDKAEPATPAERLPSASTDPLDMDIMGFDIPEVPALTEPPKADPKAIDFDEPLELPEDAESITAAPAPASAPEFDLSDINLDLDNEFTGAAAGADAAPAEPAAAGRDDTLSAHHMEMDTKLDLAIAYQEIGDKEGARELLDEVLRGGSDDQIAKANEMKAQLG